MHFVLGTVYFKCLRLQKIAARILTAVGAVVVKVLVVISIEFTKCFVARF